MAQKFEEFIQENEIDEIENQHYNQFDFEVIKVDDPTPCPECKTKMQYKGYKKDGIYFALAVCPLCAEYFSF